MAAVGWRSLECRQLKLQKSTREDWTPEHPTKVIAERRENIALDSVNVRLGKVFAWYSFNFKVSRMLSILHFSHWFSTIFPRRKRGK